MIWIGALIAAFVLAVAVVHVGRKPALNRVHSPRDILRAFTTFEVGGNEGALLCIKELKSDKFLQFRFDSSTSGHAALSFGFPNVSWSVRWYAPLQAALTEAGFDPSESVGSDGTRFLDVYDLTVPRAMMLAQLALEVLDMSDLSRLRVHFDGAMGAADMMLFNDRLREYEVGAKYA